MKKTKECYDFGTKMVCNVCDTKREKNQCHTEIEERDKS